MELLTQTEVIKKLNECIKNTVTKQAFYKRVKKGLIQPYYKANSSKKFYKFNEVARVYGVEANEIKETIVDINLFNNLESSKQLDFLLANVTTPLQKTSIIKTFWSGKAKEARYKEIREKLIYRHEAVGVINIARENFKNIFYQIPHELKAQSNIDEDMLSFLISSIDKAFYEFSKHTIKQNLS